MENVEMDECLNDRLFFIDTNPSHEEEGAETSVIYLENDDVPVLGIGEPMKLTTTTTNIATNTQGTEYSINVSSNSERIGLVG